MKNKDSIILSIEMLQNAQDEISGKHFKQTDSEFQKSLEIPLSEKEKEAYGKLVDHQRTAVKDEK